MLIFSALLVRVGMWRGPRGHHHRSQADIQMPTRAEQKNPASPNRYLRVARPTGSQSHWVKTVRF